MGWKRCPDSSIVRVVRGTKACRLEDVTRTTMVVTSVPYLERAKDAQGVAIGNVMSPP